jgi:hypothetical protein
MGEVAALRAYREGDMDHDRLRQQGGDEATDTAPDLEHARRVAHFTVHSARDGLRYRDEALYVDEEGGWYVVETGDDPSSPKRVAAIDANAALHWCRTRGVSRSTIAEYFPCDTDFGPSSEVLALLVSKWGTAEFGT